MDSLIVYYNYINMQHYANINRAEGCDTVIVFNTTNFYLGQISLFIFYFDLAIEQTQTYCTILR